MVPTKKNIFLVICSLALFFALSSAVVLKRREPCCPDACPPPCCGPKMPSVESYKCTGTQDYGESGATNQAVESCCSDQGEEQCCSQNQGSMNIVMKRWTDGWCPEEPCGCDTCCAPDIPSVESYKCEDNQQYQECCQENSGIESCGSDQHEKQCSSGTQGSMNLVMRRQFVDCAPCSPAPCGCETPKVYSSNWGGTNDYGECGLCNDAESECYSGQHEVTSCNNRNEEYANMMRKRAPVWRRTPLSMSSCWENTGSGGEACCLNDNYQECCDSQEQVACCDNYCEEQTCMD